MSLMCYTCRFWEAWAVVTHTCGRLGAGSWRTRWAWGRPFRCALGWPLPRWHRAGAPMAQGVRRKVLLRSGEGALGMGTGCVPCMHQGAMLPKSKQARGSRQASGSARWALSRERPCRRRSPSSSRTAPTTWRACRRSPAAARRRCAQAPPALRGRAWRCRARRRGVRTLRSPTRHQAQQRMRLRPRLRPPPRPPLAAAATARARARQGPTTAALRATAVP